VLTDTAGLLLAVATSAANTHDSLALIPLVQPIPAVRSRRGPRRRRPARLHADKGYDYPQLRARLRRRRITPRIARRGVENSIRLGGRPRPRHREPRGRLRTDDRAVRFVEVVVNGPKSWSLAAALRPDIAAAYDAARDRAATQIIGWLSRHATTRVGSRGGQVQVPVERQEAVTVRHYTSRPAAVV
jgi:TrwC relaxase/DDE family transposase